MLYAVKICDKRQNSIEMSQNSICSAKSGVITYLAVGEKLFRIAFYFFF